MTPLAAHSASGRSIIRRTWPRPAGLVAAGLGLLIVLRAINGRQTREELPPVGVPVTVVRVVDGDTLLLETGHRVRLLGVNTPETKHPTKPAEPFGEEASAFTANWLREKDVVLELDKERQDAFGRTLAYVVIDGALLNEQVIEAGFSRAESGFPIRSDRRNLLQAAEFRAGSGRPASGRSPCPPSRRRNADVARSTGPRRRSLGRRGRPPGFGVGRIGHSQRLQRPRISAVRGCAEALTSASAGFEDVHSDGFWLWTPDRIADRRSDLPDWFRKEGFLCFADLLLDSHYYALQWVNDTRSAVWFDWGSGPDSAEQVAGSLDELLAKVMDDPQGAGLLTRQPGSSRGRSAF